MSIWDLGYKFVCTTGSNVDLIVAASSKIRLDHGERIEKKPFQYCEAKREYKPYLSPRERFLLSPVLKAAIEISTLILARSWIV